jgi:hypothetical protein
LGIRCRKGAPPESPAARTSGMARPTGLLTLESKFCLTVGQGSFALSALVEIRGPSGQQRAAQDFVLGREAGARAVVVGFAAE